MNYVGIDIGSTCAKAVVLDANKEMLYRSLQPTGWSSVDTAEQIRRDLNSHGFTKENCRYVATGYGRVSVPFAEKTVTEITCHGLGAAQLFGDRDFAVIDIGGQDTKIILVENGMVKDFVMNDKCSAGTGRFLEIMANTMALRPDALCELAREGSGSGTKISSMCTVFAESEVISLIGRGEKKENIAYGVVSSIAEKVASQCSRLPLSGKRIYLTGGLCDCSYIREILSARLRMQVVSQEQSRYAGAIGAAITAMRLK